jgi:Txe/YoeB family toxin of Txe-Axe toxin-antitoxin module
MTFEIMEDHKPKVFTDIVVWDTEALQNRMIVQQQGVYLGQVLLFILKKWFKVEPQPEQILYEVVDIGSRQVKKGWRLLNIVDVEDVYEISLDRLDV